MENCTDSAQVSDAALMLAYADGDTEAFAMLYQRHRRSLYHYIRRQCRNDADTAEIYQDIWTSVIHARASYTDSAPYKAWLYRIARNRLIDFHRQHRNGEESFDEEHHHDITVIQSPLQPEEMAQADERQQWLESALGTLPGKQREVILLRHVAGMSLLEMADLLDEKAETVKSRLRYALIKLRAQLRMQA